MGAAPEWMMMIFLVAHSSLVYHFLDKNIIELNQVVTSWISLSSDSQENNFEGKCL